VRAFTGSDLSQFTCFTSTKVQILTLRSCRVAKEDLSRSQSENEKLRLENQRLLAGAPLLYWYKSTCFTGTKVQILTPEELHAENQSLQAETRRNFANSTNSTTSATSRPADAAGVDGFAKHVFDNISGPQPERSPPVYEHNTSGPTPQRSPPPASRQSDKRGDVPRTAFFFSLFFLTNPLLFVAHGPLPRTP
jgi:hypothetical protein